MIPRLIVPPFICCHHLVLQHDNARSGFQAIVAHVIPRTGLLYSWKLTTSLLDPAAQSADVCHQLSTFSAAPDCVCYIRKHWAILASCCFFSQSLSYKAEQYFTGHNRNQSVVYHFWPLKMIIVLRYTRTVWKFKVVWCVGAIHLLPITTCPALRGLVCFSRLTSWTLQRRATLRQTTSHTLEFSIKPPVHTSLDCGRKAKCPERTPRTEYMQIPGGPTGIPWRDLDLNLSALSEEKLKTLVHCNPTPYS